MRSSVQESAGIAMRTDLPPRQLVIPRSLAAGMGCSLPQGKQLCSMVFTPVCNHADPRQS